VHQDPPDWATGALLVAVGADDDEGVELESGVVVVVVVVVAAAVGVTVAPVAFPCGPITAATSAAAAVAAVATAVVTRFTRRLPAARTFVFALSISMST
jgi:hypothetical protein